MPLQTLKGEFRPMPGGAQILTDPPNPPNPLGSLSSFFSVGNICTSTIVAERFGIAGIVTASDCTTARGGPENTQFFQSGATPFGVDYVGHESADPNWTAGGPSCPATRHSQSLTSEIKTERWMLSHAPRHCVSHHQQA